MSDQKVTNDFPYYNGQPVTISLMQWLFVMFMVAAGFAALIAPIPLFADKYGQFIPAILFFALPLLGLILVSKGQWTAIFRKIRGIDIVWIFAFAILNIVVSIIVGYIIVNTLGANANPAGEILANAAGSERVLFYLKAIPQIFGEELLTILPFLAALYVCSSILKLPRLTSILIALLFAVIIFAAVHLPTYQWNFIQCFVVIGAARVVLMMSYFLTKNIWVSTGVHILNDWIIFSLPLITAAANA